ncbi:unnamed protein product [Moneuplotes crassus]|uniref:Uncharacterized protein n=1 Tax=Euplotes crassus TaxID=5936 RepID=A0AAD1ULC4_EUPCR|nr:unnamed protein product [Moneuplotes crassus]
MEIGTNQSYFSYHSPAKLKDDKSRFETETSRSFQKHTIDGSDQKLTRMPQLRRIVELYSVHKDDQEIDDQSGSSCSPKRLRPGSLYNDSSPKKASTIEKASDHFTNRSKSIGQNSNRYAEQASGNIIPRYRIGKRSSSTYQNHFEVTPAKILKEKSLNNNPNFKYEQMSYNHKFPPIPKARMIDRLSKSPFETKTKDYQNVEDLSPSLKRFMLNKTVNKSVVAEPLNKEAKIKSKLARKNSILQKIADSSLKKEPELFKPMSVSISDVMKTSFDRPKVTAVQDTLHGIFQTSAHLKQQQRHKKFKTWGGLKIPITHNGIFNKNKDIMSKWDEVRDGIFNKL